MSQVTVHKLNSSAPAAQLLMQELEHASSRIRQRAFELFQQRDGTPGDPVDDWLRAENELFAPTRIEVRDGCEEFEIELILEEFAPGSMIVNALPDSIVVQGESLQNRKPSLRQVCLPEEIDPLKVTATVRQGVLTNDVLCGDVLGNCVLSIVAQKRRAAPSKSQPVQSERSPMEHSVAA